MPASFKAVAITLALQATSATAGEQPKFVTNSQGPHATQVVAIAPNGKFAGDLYVDCASSVFNLTVVDDPSRNLHLRVEKGGRKIPYDTTEKNDGSDDDIVVRHRNNILSGLVDRLRISAATFCRRGKPDEGAVTKSLQDLLAAIPALRRNRTKAPPQPFVRGHSAN